MKVILLKPQEFEFNVIDKKEFEELDQMYQKLNCTIIEHYRVTFKGKEFTLVLDEIGKWNSENKPCIFILNDSKPIDHIVGKVAITKYDERGEQVGLTNEEVELIKQDHMFSVVSYLVDGDDEVKLALACELRG